MWEQRRVCSMGIQFLMLVTSWDKGQENTGKRGGAGRMQVHLNVIVNESVDYEIES